jgi:general secretion pathway protein C
MAAMQRIFSRPTMTQLSAWLVALLLGLTATYWVLRWPVADNPSISGSMRAPQASSANDNLPPEASALAALLGATAAPSAAAVDTTLGSRMVLVGVVAQPGGHGAALIAIDGKPAQPFAIGSTIEPGLFLKALGPRKALLSRTPYGPTSDTLDMPAQVPEQMSAQVTNQPAQRTDANTALK